MTCKIQRQQDEFYCSECNKRWDVNDDPAPCGKQTDVPVSGGVSRRGVPMHRDTYTEWRSASDHR